ncbi:MAG: rhodanese-like domain-containing protein [Gammaproteobacteria bacterium]|nr:rhodanese-like domain-containing protein [Gammaproteobacteria bacterium]MCW8986720.1 rhodanese-like domain-containing protein [Gammaproteobacteria bacterium]MCW9032423.1 rhodanese-like domain-containing protein [Gammaproteobacteria bacterium]
MNQLITFTSNNTILVISILIVSLMLIYSFIGEKLRGYSSVSPVQSTQMINRDDAIMLDVREINEYSEGHIINSVHIPLSNLNSRMSELDKHKSQKVIVACRSGHRSSNACANLKKNGFEQVFNLSGGVMAWQNANLPLIKK